MKKSQVMDKLDQETVTWVVIGKAWLKNINRKYYRTR